MSLFLPSNLSPNFEEVFYRGGIMPVDTIDFEFQVNTNGSSVRSYKLELLNDKNDADVPEDNILATFYGLFDPPLYNKDTHTIKISVEKIFEQVQLEVPKDYRWRLRLYEDIIDYNKDIVDISHNYGSTYVGAGNIVGSTKNTIWLNNSNEHIVEDKYIQTILDSADTTNDFNPFNIKYLKGKQTYKDLVENVENTEVQKGVIKNYTRDMNDNVDGFIIDINDILPEYRKKISNGNMYIKADITYNNSQNVPIYDTNVLPKLIVNTTNTDSDTLDTEYVIKIDSNQIYTNHINADLQFIGTYSLVYIQRQQIYSVSKSVGTHQLTKITLDEPLDYNTFHDTYIETGLVSDNFDFNRIYVDPVKEFDSKLVPSAYVNIAYSEEQLIDIGGSQQYILLTEKPNDWDDNCENYFYKDAQDKYVKVSKEYQPLSLTPEEEEKWSSVYKTYFCVNNEYNLINDLSAPVFNSEKYYKKNIDGTFTLLSEEPDNWETAYKTYYIQVQKYQSMSNYVDPPEYQDEIYFKYSSPVFNDNNQSYYQYGISSQFLSSYTHSLACVQLTNYVSKTGECSLYSDLKFKPDIYYMYQIFVIDQDAPNYNPANSINPYKFYTGTYFVNNEETDRYYLGGYNGDLTVDFNIRDNLLKIYSNHRIGETNQFLCFIQPNLGIYEDKYKPCMLQLYNNKYQKDVYVTNYNGNNTYNKDYSIDTLDDSQWLVAFTYIGDDIVNTTTLSQLIQLIEKPQTKYKIYTNFVNSIPESYFYYRSDKTLKFEYLDLYNRTALTTEPYPLNDSIKIIPRRDIYVKCKIFDSNDTSEQKNLVPIKYYKYCIATVNSNNLNDINDIIYESDFLYDGKYEYAIRGLNTIYDKGTNIIDDPQLYRIEIFAEDEYGGVYNFYEYVYFGYQSDIVNDRITAKINCNEQAIHIDFSPVKTFSGEGTIEYNDNNSVTITDPNGLLFSSLQDISGNQISIPENFVFYTKIKIGAEMFNEESEQDLFVIEDDKNNQYKVTFDTRVYVENSSDTSKITINSNYLSFRLYKNNEHQTTQDQHIDDIFKDSPSPFIKPEAFEYMINGQENEQGIYVGQENEQGVYVIEESESKQSVSGLNISGKSTNGDQYLIAPASGFIYDNNGSDINRQNRDLGKMTFLYFKVTNNSLSVSEKNNI